MVTDRKVIRAAVAGVVLRIVACAVILVLVAVHRPTETSEPAPPAVEWPVQAEWEVLDWPTSRLADRAEVDRLLAEGWEWVPRRNDYGNVALISVAREGSRK